MKIQYKPVKLQRKTLELIEQANEIVDQSQRDGYMMSLRQLHYQLVTRILILNNDKSYKKLGRDITNGRDMGLVDWDMIEDRHRSHHRFSFQESERGAIQELSEHVRFDYWDRQPIYVEVWVEKDSLINIIAKACHPYFVPYMACKGYMSSSQMQQAAQRFKQKLMSGKECILLHLGDLDPSGVDMTRDIQDRLDTYTTIPQCVEVRRIGLNMDQVRQYAPPPNYAKLDDSRAHDYIKKYGRQCWELDALEPQVLEKLIIDEIKPMIDRSLWNDTGAQELALKQKLVLLDSRWEEIQNLLSK